MTLQSKIIIQPIFGLAAAILISTISQPVIAAENVSSVPLSTRVERLERRIGQLTEMMMQLDALKRENSELRGQIELQTHLIESLKKRQRDLYIDIDQRLSQLQTGAQPASVPSAPVTASTTVPATSSPAASTVQQAAPTATAYAEVRQASTVTANEEAEYQQAYKLLSPSQKRYPEAIKALKAFLKKHPQSSLADNAQYWLAEAYYVSQNNDAALEEFIKLTKQYPGSPKVSGALLKIGYLQHAAGNNAEAKKALNEVIQSYPESSAATMAKKRLQQIK